MDEAMSERVKLLQEAAILAQFRHPNVVRLHGITNKDNVVRSIRISHLEEPYNIEPKLRFSTCPVYQNMTFLHISNTYLAEDRAEFYANK